MSPRPRLGLQGLSGTTVDQDFRIRLPRWKNFPSSRPFHVTFEMSILHSLMVATCRYTNKLTYWSTVIFLKLTFWSLNDLILKLNRPNVGLAGFMTYPKNYYYYLPQFYSFPSYESYGQNCQRIRKWPHWRRMRKIEMMKRILTRSFKRFWTRTHIFHRMFESVVKSLEKCPEICSNCSGVNYFGHCIWYLGSERAFYASGWISTRNNWMVDCDAYRYSNRFNERIFHSLSLLLQVIFSIFD